MKWFYENAGRDVELPATLLNGLPQEAKVGSQTYEFVWQRDHQCLMVRPKNSTVAPKVLHLRSHSIDSTMNDGDLSILLEYSISGRHEVLSQQGKISIKKTRPSLGLAQEKARGPAKVKSPMAAKVIQIIKDSNAKVQKGESLMILEAMKMENRITAPISGILDSIAVKVGDLVSPGQELAKINPEV